MAGNRFIWSSWSKKTKLEIFRNVDKVEDFLKSADEIAESGIAIKELRRSAKKFDVPTDKVKKFATDLANPPRRNHILHGDATGGGHLFPGKPGKTVFPESWSGDKIMHEASDIVTDPTINWKQIRGPAGEDFTRRGTPSRWEAVGTRDGVEIKVIVEPAGEGIVTAFPIGGPGVITNP